MNNTYINIINQLAVEIKNKYEEVVRPLDENVLGYLLTINKIDSGSNDCIRQLENALLEEIEVSGEIRDALFVAELNDTPFLVARST